MAAKSRREHGRLVMFAFKKDSKLTVDCGLIQQKNLWLTGSRLRPRPIAEKRRLAAAVRKAVWPLIESGDFKPVESTFPLRQSRPDASAGGAQILSSCSRMNSTSRRAAVSFDGFDGMPEAAYSKAPPAAEGEPRFRKMLGRTAPCRTRDVRQVSMETGEHIGKVLLTMWDGPKEKVFQPSQLHASRSSRRRGIARIAKLNTKSGYSGRILQTKDERH